MAAIPSVNTLIYQGDEEGCGLACLRMLLVRLSKNPRYRYLTLESHPPYSLAELKKEASKQGLELSFKRALGKEDLYSNEKWPLILLLGPEKDSHMVLALKSRGRKILILDPAEGKRYRKKEEVFDEWNGIFGEIVSYSKCPCPYHRPKALGKGPLCGVSFLTIAAQSVLYYGFYTISEEGSYLWTILAFSFFSLFEIAAHFSSVFMMKRFDRAYLARIYDVDERRLEKNYRHYYAYKKSYFGGWVEFLSSFFFSLALSFLVGYNNLYFFVAVAGIGLYLFLETFFYEKRLRAEKSQLENEERSLFKETDCEGKKRDKIKKINDDSYKIGDFISYSAIIRILLILSLAAIPSLAKGEFSLNYYLFHFFALLSVAEWLKKVATFFYEEPQREQEYDYFLEYFLKNEKRE